MTETETTEIAAEPGPPRVEEARDWLGAELDDLDGAAAGRVEGLYVDAESSAPAWVVVSVARRGLLPLRRRPVTVVIPARDCAGAAGRAWTAHLRREIAAAPVVDPARPLLREHEIAICSHYGIGPQAGRAAEVVGRAESAVTAVPAP